MRIIGEVTGETGYAGLIAALRLWICDLGTSLETVACAANAQWGDVAVFAPAVRNP